MQADTEPREALATLYRKGAEQYRALMTPVFQKRAASSEQEAKAVARLTGSGQYLIDHLHEVPVHVIPLRTGDAGGAHPGGLYIGYGF